ncbi:MAG: PAS domain S-box protein, partial [bacterium]
MEFSRPNGEKRNLLITAVPRYDSQGKFVGTFGVFRDITERKRAEEALQKSLTLYSGLIETTGTGFVILNNLGNVVDANEEYLRLSGHENLSQILGRNVVEWTAEYEKEKNAEAVGQCLREGQLRNFEIDYVNAEGKITPIEINSTVVTVDGANQILTLCRDITERKRAEESLRESEEKFRLAFDTSPDAIAISRLADGLIVSVNKGFLRLSGYTQEEVIGKAASEINSWKDPEDRRKFVKEMQSRGEVRNYEVRLLTSSGEIFGLMSASIVNLSGEPHVLATTRDITERKQIEEAMRISEASLAEAQRITHLGSWELNLITGQAIWSDELCRLFEISPETVRKESSQRQTAIEERIHPDDRARYREMADQSLRQKIPYEIEHRIQLPGGAQRWIHALGVPTLDQAGNLVRLAGTAMDITERKQAEDLLKRGEQRLRNVINGTNAGTWEWNVQTGESSIDEESAAILGYSREEFQSISFETWMGKKHPDDMKESNELLQKHLQGETDYYSFESRMQHKDGHWVWVLGRGKVIEWDNHGKPLRIFGTHMDITDRKQAEQDLRESEEQYRTLFETMTEGVVVLSPDGQILHANLAAEHILGINRAEIEGHQYNSPGWELLRPDGTPMPPEEMAAILTIGGIRPLKAVEIGFKRSDGFVSWINLNAAPLLDQAGELRSVVGTFRDITDREQLKRETAKKITSQLTAGIAHQIRNPLFVISLSVQSIEKKLPAKDPQRRLTQAILSKVHKLDVVTADLVHLGKYHRLQITKASLNQCLEQALILVRAPAK